MTENKEPNGQAPASQPERQLLYLFTRTPLHVGAGASVGAIDQPIQREKHTGFPVIPGSALKGVFADASREWTGIVDESKTGKDDSGKEVAYIVKKGKRTETGQWLFGAESDTDAAAGALRFAEAKLLAFPIRSGKGGYAWITSPLLLRRFARDGGMPSSTAYLPAVEPADGEAVWKGNTIAISPSNQPGAPGEIVLEDYSFCRMRNEQGDILLPDKLEQHLIKAFPDDPVWANLTGRLVIVSDGMLSYFARAACEVMQRNRIDDVTGTVADGALFNQENIPVDTLFYSIILAWDVHVNGSVNKPSPATKKAVDAIQLLDRQLKTMPGIQIGGDAGIGLGNCSARLDKTTWSAKP